MNIKGDKNRSGDHAVQQFHGSPDAGENMRKRMKGNLLIWVLLAVFLVGAAAYWYFYHYQPQQQLAAPPPIPPEPAVTEPAFEPEPEIEKPQDFTYTQPEPTEPEETLPPLMESDPIVLDSMAALVGQPQVYSFFVTEDVIPRAVAAVDAMSSRQVPDNIMPVRGAAGAFEATSDDRPGDVILGEDGEPMQQYVMDPVNFQRYNAHVELIEAVAVDELADTYRAQYPWFQQAYRDLGYPDANFNDRLVEVIDELLATPEPEAPVRMVKPEAVYLFIDPELESLSAGQKTLLRMGPANAERVKEKLRDLREAIVGLNM
jgi:hypothetical protein